MNVRFNFGSFPPVEANWWGSMEYFPKLVIYKDKKWEFVMYGNDLSGNYDQVCTFSEVHSFDPNWHAVPYTNIDYLFVNQNDNGCECGSVHTSFPNHHMFFCKKWSKN